jgi:hypothetical protein
MKRMLSVLTGAAMGWGALAPSAAEAPRSKRQDAEPPQRSVSIDEVRTETGYTLDAMRLESDIIYAHDRFDQAHRRPFEVDSDALTLQLALGVTDWLTAKAILPFRRLAFDPGDTESGIGDIGVEGRVSLKYDRSPIGFVPGVDVAAALRITFPTGDEDRGLGELKATFRPYVSVSHWLKSWFGLHGSAFLEWQEGEKPIHGAHAAAEFIPWGRSISLLAALDVTGRGSESSAVTFIPGAEYRLIGLPLSLGLGIPIGFTNKAEDWGIILNVQAGF